MADQIPVLSLTEPTKIEEYISFEDFLKRYDGVYAEWFMGKVEVYVSNNVVHNLILSFLDKLLGFYLDFQGIGKLLLAGVPMKISDEQPAREPDLLIILNENLHRIKTTYVEGAADIVVEIVSPESTERDRGAKFQEYEAVGVREYWMFDPLRQESVIYALGDDQRYHRVNVDSHGQLSSTLLPNFALDPSLLWRDELPAGQEILDLLRAMGVM